MLPFQTIDNMNLQSRNALRAGNRITNVEPGSIAGSLIEAFNAHIADLATYVKSQTTVQSLEQAIGPALDMIGDMFSLPRRIATAAVVSPEDKILKFYSSTGVTLASLLPSKVIPSGTLITTTTGDITFAVNADYTFNDVQTEVFVGATASSAGTGSNIGRGVLAVHDLGVASILVTNIQTIQNGTERESDTSYRYRLSRVLRSHQAANIAAIEDVMGILPGVIRAEVREWKSGVGTFQVMLLPSATVVPEASLAVANAVAQTVKAAGMYMEVRAPEYVPVEVIIQLTFTPKTTAKERSDIAGRVPIVIYDYLDDIPIGGQLIINEIRQRVMDIDEKILDMQIKCLAIRKKVQLLRNFQLFEDELFIPDPDAADPVKVLY